MKPWQWAALLAVFAAAFLLRVHDVSRIFLWLDEGDMFNEWVYSDHPKSLVDFALTTRDATTVTWGWPAVIWIVSRTFGSTIGTARIPTLVANTAGVALLFALVYQLLAGFVGDRFWPALFAAIFAGISVVQLDYGQRAYPYGVTPFAALAVLVGHFEILRATGADGWKATPRLLRALLLYTLAIVFSFCMHASATLIPAISMAAIAYRALKGLRSNGWDKKIALWGAVSAGAILAAAALNIKNPKYGYRPYLADYYLPLSFASIPKLLAHAYALATYHLNLFYNAALYYPDRLNAAVLPLVLICVFGWWLAALRKFGEEFRHLALLSAAAVALPAALSLVKVFPFGGVRQLLFLGPLLMAFAALGFYALRANAFTKFAAIAIGSAYLALWAVNLPRFYRERLPQYTPDEIVAAWRDNPGLPIYAQFSEREFWYELRDHPEIHVRGLTYSAKPPYLLVTTHNWVGDGRWFAGYPEYLRQAGYRLIVLKQAEGFHIDNRLPSQSLYFPPNGFWIYKITAP
jgi:hypothetical protein